jgi:hypothetical protein
MVSSGMLRLVALVRTDVSKELSASFIRVTRIGELGKTLALTSNRRTQRASVLHSHRRENLKSYTEVGGSHCNTPQCGDVQELNVTWLKLQNGFNLQNERLPLSW